MGGEPHEGEIEYAFDQGGREATHMRERQYMGSIRERATEETEADALCRSREGETGYIFDTRESHTGYAKADALCCSGKGETGYGFDMRESQSRGRT